MYEIIMYDTKDGDCPVKSFLDSLEPKLLAKTLRTIDLLEKNGPELGGPHSSLIEDGASAPPIISSTVSPLLITFLILWEPASGANVMLDLRTS